MTLTELQKKLIILALDKSAKDGEIATASVKLILSLRKDYDGHSFLKALENAPRASNGHSDQYHEEDKARAYKEGYAQGKWDAESVERAKRTERERNNARKSYHAKRTETFGQAPDPSGDFVMKFGKHTGKKLREIPLEYSVWLTSIDLTPETRRAVETWLNANSWTY